MCAVIDVARSALLCARAGHVGKAEEEEECTPYEGKYCSGSVSLL